MHLPAQQHDHLRPACSTQYTAVGRPDEIFLGFLAGRYSQLSGKPLFVHIGGAQL